ncbi:MAG: hypothetical protein LBT90_00660 [Holosporaceae bacterium]|nr:hypothetical protein [Holosporaceae bacterium]
MRFGINMSEKTNRRDALSISICAPAAKNIRSTVGEAPERAASRIALALRSVPPSSTKNCAAATGRAIPS